jgi:hypothetical protein
MKKLITSLSLCGLAFGSLFSSASFASIAKEDELGKTVAQVWQALSHAAGSGADTIQLKKLFHSQAQVFGATYRRGEAKLDIDPIQTFIRNVSKKNVQGFYECEIARETKVYEHFAHVYSVVESRQNAQDDKPNFVGVNSLQLYKTEQGWKVLSLFYHIENKDSPIRITQGKSGQCLKD